MACFTPIEVFVKSAGHAYLVPCNKCANCLNRKKQTWIFRLEQELRYGKFKNCFFITLTYNDVHVPYESWTNVIKGNKSNFVSTGERVLRPYDLRLFLQRYRSYYDSDFRYFGVGEYGEDRNRPHLHLLFYTNCDYRTLLERVRVCWSRLIPESKESRLERYRAARLRGVPCKRDARLLSNRDSFGFVTIKSVTFRRICYVAKYVNKLFGSMCVPPFYRASHGLGDGFLQSEVCKLSQLNNTHFAYFSNGRASALHRFYSRKMFTADQMADFQLKMINLSSIPLDLPRHKVVEYVHNACIKEKSARTRLTFAFNYVPRI